MLFCYPYDLSDYGVASNVMMDMILQTMELHQMWWWMWSCRPWSCIICDDGCDLADHGVASHVMMDVILQTMKLHQMWWWMWSCRPWSCIKCDDGCDLADHGVASHVMMDVILQTMELYQMWWWIDVRMLHDCCWNFDVGFTSTVDGLWHWQSVCVGQRAWWGNMVKFVWCVNFCTISGIIVMFTIFYVISMKFS
jgi:hypothetical protein